MREKDAMVLSENKPNWVAIFGQPTTIGMVLRYDC
jgi:hypothetical protein